MRLAKFTRKELWARKAPEPVMAYAKKINGVLSVNDIYPFTREAKAKAVASINRTRRESIVPVQISEVYMPQKRKDRDYK